MSQQASAPRISVLTSGKLAEATLLLEQACEFDRVHLVAREKLFGEGSAGHKSCALGAYLGETLVAVASTSHQWIRLLAVLPAYRGSGVGSALLDACLAKIRAHCPEARIMDQPGNYLSPGVDKRDTETIAWLERRGFSIVGTACNLLIRLQGNPKVSARHFEDRMAAAKARGYAIGRVTPQQVEPTAAMIEGNFSASWAFEIRQAAAHSPAGVFLALVQETGEAVAFAAHDGNNQGLGSFGPAGTADAHRGKGLGAALLLSCLLDIRDAGHTHAEVAWIGPREFYDKIAGIDSERHFCAMTKTLTHKTLTQGNTND